MVSSFKAKDNSESDDFCRKIFFKNFPAKIIALSSETNMSYALSHLSLVPVRSSPADRSEQVSQLLFGEIVEILEQKGRSWSKVRCTWDNCIGWVQARQIQPLTNAEAQLFQQKFAYCLDLFQPLMSDDFHMPIPLGARLPDFDGMKFSFDGKTYFYSGQAVFPENLEPRIELALKIARRYLFAPYHWGGRSPMGIDAPGFTQIVFKMIVISLHREAEQQVSQGDLIDFMEQAQPGDLAFFENHAGNVSHVGILLPDSKIIHAAEQVRIDKIDHYGIFNEELERYTHRLRVVKRVLPPAAAPVSRRKEEAVFASNQVVLFD